MSGGVHHSRLVTLQSAAAATGNGTPIDITGLSSIGVQVTGTFVGTITWEVTVDGTNWLGILLAPPSTGTGALTAAATGLFTGSVAGMAQFRARVSAYTSGAITVVALATAAAR